MQCWNWNSDSQFRAPPIIIQTFFIDRRNFFVGVKYEFENAQFGFAQQGNPIAGKRTEETTVNKFSADPGSDEWNTGTCEELFEIPGDVTVKTSVGLQRTAAGLNHLVLQNGPAQSHLFQSSKDAKEDALYPFLLVNNHQLIMSIRKLRQEGWLDLFWNFFTKDESAV